MIHKLGRERESVDREGGKEGNCWGFGRTERLHSKEEKRSGRWRKEEVKTNKEGEQEKSKVVGGGGGSRGGRDGRDTDR